MARVNVPTNVEGPDQIDISLVREDYLGVANLFQFFFNIFLAIFSCLLGVILSADKEKIYTIHWCSFWGSLILAALFLAFSFCYGHKAKCKSKKNN